MSVTYEVRDGIAFIAFDRREKHNALRDEDLEALSRAVQMLDTDEDAKVAILSGNGPSFSSGGDMKARLQKSMEEGSTSGRVNEREAFLDCVNWKPIIAAIHGYCLGHALATALLCDHLVAARGATFQVTETKVGLAMPNLLPKLGYPAFANDVAMTGRMFSAEEAWSGGMLTRLVDDGEHLRSAEGLAHQILDNPQTPVREYVRVRRTLIKEDTQRFRAISGDFDWANSAEAKDAVAQRMKGLGSS
jgi:enoyl-CoA hydratase/carnithine racemase